MHYVMKAEKNVHVVGGSNYIYLSKNVGNHVSIIMVYTETLNHVLAQRKLSLKIDYLSTSLKKLDKNLPTRSRTAETL